MSAFRVVYEDARDAPYKRDERVPEIQNLLPPSARMAVGPAGSIPNARAPMPTTTESNKKTNNSIPYSRRSGETVTPYARGPEPGELVMLHRGGENNKPSFGTVYSLARVNELLSGRTWPLEDMASLHPNDSIEEKPTTEDLVGARLPVEVSNYTPDGFVRVIEESVGHGEHLSNGLLNIIIQGPCLALNRKGSQELAAVGERCGGWVYCALFKTKRSIRQKRKKSADAAADAAAAAETEYEDVDHFEFEFKTFSACQVRVGDVNVDNVCRYWRLGRILDAEAVPKPEYKTINLNVSIHPPVFARKNLVRKTYNASRRQDIKIKGGTATELLKRECTVVPDVPDVPDVPE